MKNNVVGSSILSVMALAVGISLAALAIPSYYSYHRQMKQSLFETAFRTQLERTLRRKYSDRSIWTLIGCAPDANGVNVCPPSAGVDQDFSYNVPGCTPTAGNTCVIQVQVRDNGLSNNIDVNINDTRNTGFVSFFQIPYPERSAGPAAIECDPTDPATLGKAFLVDVAGQNGQPRCVSFNGYTPGMGNVMARCPAGQYLSSLQVATQDIVCKPFNTTATSCAANEFIDSVNWNTSNVTDSSGTVTDVTLSLVVTCAPRRVTL